VEQDTGRLQDGVLTQLLLLSQDKRRKEQKIRLRYIDTTFILGREPGFLVCFCLSFVIFPLSCLACGKSALIAEYGRRGLAERSRRSAPEL
jgi:hypothetical protein